MEWVLVLILFQTNGVAALSNIPGFISEQQCMTAGEQFKDTMSGFFKPSSRFTCVVRGSEVTASGQPDDNFQ